MDKHWFIHCGAHHHAGGKDDEKEMNTDLLALRVLQLIRARSCYQ